MNNAEYLQQESGGKTKVVLVNRIFKEATDERMLKLVDEFEFIESIPEEFKDKFPKIIFYGTDENRAFYEMEAYNLPTIRRLMLAGQIGHDEVLYWTDKITEFSLRMYNKEVIPRPDEYFDVMHFGRVRKRFDELRKKSDWFKETLQATHIEINGQTYLNTPYVVDNYFDNQRFLYGVQPEFVGRWSHSDLHYSNILIDRENDNFILVDPRGYDYCDYYYDYGKLWHSINGKYEMIASRAFTVGEGTFQLERNNMFKLCEALKSTLPDILYKYSKEDPIAVMRKTECNEVMHFIGLVPFLLDYDGIDARAKVAYYTSVILANHFCIKYL